MMSQSQPFSFGFGSDDIEGTADETMDVEPSYDEPGYMPAAVTEPKLHTLQDLVWNITLTLHYQYFDRTLSHL